MAVTHAKTSTKSDGADASLIRPSDWNAAHVGTNDHGHTATGDGGSLAVAGGYAPLSSSLLVPVAYLGSGTPDATKFLRGDGTWQPVSGGGGGWPPAFGAAPTVVESVAWTNATSASMAISLASIPQTGDVIFMAQTSNQYDAILPSGGGATWTLVDGVNTFNADRDGTYLWMGIVGGSPSAACTAKWSGHNIEAVALMNVRGLSGVVERSFSQALLIPAVYAGGPAPLWPILGTIAIALASSRSGTSMGTVGGGYTTAQAANVGPGYQSLVYKITSQLVNCAPTWPTLQSGNSTLNWIHALIY